jgi:hypothetical protein
MWNKFDRAHSICAYNNGMLHTQTGFRATAPLFSVIIPLEYHRGQWERCWQGWQSQSLDRESFEIILVVPPGFPERDRLGELADPAPRLEYSQHSHDIALCADGAASARGKFLFFTEAHCWPEPDVLELCLQALHLNPGWAGFSCKSMRVCPNRLSEAEADMYEADTEFGMKVHPWRKILDVCFVTRREAYEECGGLKPEFGHFSEWALAANYFEHGHKIGFLPEALVHHYYIGSLAELKAFTLDFVEGEIRYFSRGLHEPVSTLLEIPPELIGHDNFNRGMARAILRMIVKDLLTLRAADRRSQQALFAIGRWASPAISGDGIARGAVAAVALYAYLAAALTSVAGSRGQLGVRFKRYIEALIRYQRLNCLRTERLSKTAVRMPGVISAPGDNTTILEQTGFYPLEKYDGNRFRWSEMAAAIRLQTNAGHQSIRIQCVPVRRLSLENDLRLYFDGRRIPDDAISTGIDTLEIRINVPTSGAHLLGWICRPFPAKADSRRLGLPILHVELISRDDDVKAMEVNSSSLHA